MDEKYLYILLSIVKNNGDAKKLKREGLEYSEIADLLSGAIDNGLIEYLNDEIGLTEEGFGKLKELGISYKRRNKSLWIDEEKESKIDKLPENFIFLPNQNDLDF